LGWCAERSNSGRRANGWWSPWRQANVFAVQSTEVEVGFEPSIEHRAWHKFHRGMLRGMGFPSRLRCSDRRIGGATHCMRSRNTSPAATMLRDSHIPVPDADQICATDHSLETLSTSSPVLAGSTIGVQKTVSANTISNSVHGYPSRGGRGFSDRGVSGNLPGQYSNRRTEIHEETKT
jgi:hypothetical protein